MSGGTRFFLSQTDVQLLARILAFASVRHPIYLCYRGSKAGHMIGFVEYPSARDAEIAIKMYNGMRLGPHRVPLIPYLPRALRRPFGAVSVSAAPGGSSTSARYRPYSAVAGPSRRGAPMAPPTSSEFVLDAARPMEADRPMPDYIPLDDQPHGNAESRIKRGARGTDRVTSSSSDDDSDSSNDMTDEDVAPATAYDVDLDEEVSAAATNAVAGEPRAEQRSYHGPFVEPDTLMVVDDSDGDQELDSSSDDDDSDSDIVEIPYTNIASKPRHVHAPLVEPDALMAGDNSDNHRDSDDSSGDDNSDSDIVEIHNPNIKSKARHSNELAGPSKAGPSRYASAFGWSGRTIFTV